MLCRVHFNAFQECKSCHTSQFNSMDFGWQPGAQGVAAMVLKWGLHALLAVLQSVFIGAADQH